MKKILIALILLIGTFAYSYNDKLANDIMANYNNIEGSDYSADKERVEEILREPYGTFGSPFDIDGDYVLSTGDFIIQMLKIFIISLTVVMVLLFGVFQVLIHVE